MANGYRIEVSVAVVKCEDAEMVQATQVGPGQIKCVLSEEQAVCIDTCESILLRATFTALRDGLAQHFSGVSLERAQAQVQGACEVRAKPYRVDGEMGRVTFNAHEVVREGQVVYDTATEMFAPLGPKEWYRTQGFKELALMYGVVDASFRKTTALLNRVRYQEAGGTPLRTLWDTAEAEGQRLQAHMEQRVDATLVAHDFTLAGVPPEGADYDHQTLSTVSAEQVAAAIQDCAPQPEWVTEMAGNPLAYEDPVRSVLIAIDDVGVKQQKASRGHASATPSEPATPEAQKRIHHTVARVAQGTATYLLTGQGVANVLRLVLAFLLHNQLLQYNLIFFVDGQRSLHTAILRAFAWFKPVQIILDWYHLMEKCKQQLSLALKGRTLRNQALDTLRPCLWHGCVDRASATLRAIPTEQIKDQKALDDLIGYFERNRSHIPCYAVRKKLGLRNSSQAGEKANDLIVSSRQKHNGMSWRLRGSAALAAITAMIKNQEFLGWLGNRSLAFSFAA